MRILLLSTAFPDEPERLTHGVYQRLGMLLGALEGMGRLDLLFFVDPETDVSPASVAVYRRRLEDFWGFGFDLRLVHREPVDGPTSRWEAYGAGMFDGFRQAKFGLATGARQQAAMEEALEDSPDVVLAHRLPAMAPLLKTKRPLPPVVFDLDDIEHVAAMRSIGQPPTWPAKRLLYLQIPALWWTERKALLLASRTFVCSEADRRRLSPQAPAGSLAVVPNAVEPRRPKPPPDRPTALFIGSLSYGPNQNAAGLLVREIWPMVRQRIPEARLTVAGRYPERVPGYDEPHPGVEFPGFVEDLDALYDRTRVVCVPILAGGGTRIKVIEAGAYGKPIVASPTGAEGLGMRDGEHLLERGNPAEFARAVVDLMRDDARCAALGKAANDFVRAEYAREQVQERVRREVTACLRS